MKRRFIATVLIVALFSLAGCSYPGAGNIDQLARGATYVVRVEVLFGRQVRVLEVFSGDIQPGDIIGVRQPTGMLSIRRLGGYSPLPLAPGNDLVLFLFTWQDGHRAHLINPFEGAYRFPDSSESTLTLDVYIELENAIHPGRGLTLTIEDLLRIAEDNFGDESREVLAHSGGGRVSPMVWLLLAALVIYWRRQMRKVAPLSPINDEAEDEDCER